MQDLIVFGEDWGGLPSSTQHLIKEMMPDRKIIWCNSIGLRSPKLTLKDIKRVWKKLAFRHHPRTNVTDTIAHDAPIIIQPKVLPFHGNPIARRINGFFLRRLVNKLITQHNLKNPILWLSLPSAIDAIPNQTIPVIYYCGDDFGGLEGVDHKPIIKMERELVTRANQILVASESLAKKFPPSKTTVLPHGVDTSLFQTPQQRPTDLPKGKPIAGLYGSLAEWIDWDMLHQAAITCPDWNFVFIGTIKADVAALERLPNVFFLGAKPHHQLPGYVQHWNISLLPFRDTPQIQACNPLKLREYMAVGKPILTTDFPAAHAYKQHVKIAKTPETFVKYLQDQGQDTATQKEHRTMAIQHESWKARAQQALSAVAVLTLVVGCAGRAPLSYIPPTERTQLQAEAHKNKTTSVADILQQARQPSSDYLTLTFEKGSHALTARQQKQLKASPKKPIALIYTAPDSAEASFDDALIAHKRAAAVTAELPTLEIEHYYQPTQAPSTVRVSFSDLPEQ